MKRRPNLTVSSAIADAAAFVAGRFAAVVALVAPQLHPANLHLQRAQRVHRHFEIDHAAVRAVLRTRLRVKSLAIKK